VRLINHKPAIDDLFMNSRAGILRPFVAILFLAAAYWLYQKYKQPILRTTGNFVNAFGRDTLWLFVAQAFAIPILAALPIQRNIINNLVLTSFFFGLMVLINRRSLIVSNVKNRTKEFKTAASAKYLYGAEDI
jgi:hypothetical protein